MKQEEQRIAIAKQIPKLRWEVVADYSERWLWPSGVVTGPPDDDLNAMHEAVSILSYEDAEQFEDELCDICTRSNDLLNNPAPWKFAAVNATAAQRAEAFLRTLNLWTDNT